MATTRIRRTFRYSSASDGEESDGGRDEMDEEGEFLQLLLSHPHFPLSGSRDSVSSIRSCFRRVCA